MATSKRTPKAPKATSYTLTPEQLTDARAIVALWNARRNETRKGMIAASKRRGEIAPQLVIAKADISEVIAVLLAWELEALSNGR